MFQLPHPNFYAFNWDLSKPKAVRLIQPADNIRHSTPYTILRADHLKMVL